MANITAKDIEDRKKCAGIFGYAASSMGLDKDPDLNPDVVELVDDLPTGSWAESIFKAYEEGWEASKEMKELDAFVQELNARRA